jgi:hypothetical protein
VLVDTLMVRRLPPYLANVGKRLVKSPKIYLRDSGLLHALLGLSSVHDLQGHPIAGSSWEGFVIEQVVAQLPPQALASFYRTAAGAEIDLVIETGSRRIGVEVKFSAQGSSPGPGLHRRAGAAALCARRRRRRPAGVGHRRIARVTLAGIGQPARRPPQRRASQRGVLKRTMLRYSST